MLDMVSVNEARALLEDDIDLFDLAESLMEELADTLFKLRLKIKEDSDNAKLIASSSWVSNDADKLRGDIARLKHMRDYYG